MVIRIIKRSGVARPRFGSEQTILMETSLAEHMSLADLAAFKHTPANGSWSLRGHEC